MTNSGKYLVLFSLLVLQSQAFAQAAEEDKPSAAREFWDAYRGTNSAETRKYQTTSVVAKRLTNETGISFTANVPRGTVIGKLSSQQAANMKATLDLMSPEDRKAALGRIAIYHVDESTNELIVSGIPGVKFTGMENLNGLRDAQFLRVEMAGNGIRGPVLRGMLAGDMEAVRKGLEVTGPAVEREGIEAKADVPADRATEVQGTFDRIRAVGRSIPFLGSGKQPEESDLTPAQNYEYYQRIVASQKAKEARDAENRP